MRYGYQFDTLYWTQSMLKEGASEHIIFSHNFAKAFWGEEETYTSMKYTEIKGEDKDIIHVRTGRKTVYQLEFPENPIPAWQYHLQQLVLEESPLDYIKKFL